MGKAFAIAAVFNVMTSDELLSFRMNARDTSQNLGNGIFHVETYWYLTTTRQTKTPIPDFFLSVPEIEERRTDYATYERLFMNE